MDEKLITLPDEDLIKQFSPSKEDKEGEIRPLYVDGHVDLPYFMMKNWKGTIFSDLKEGPFTYDLSMESGVRLFTSALYCEDHFNGAGAFQRFRDIFEYIIKYIDEVIFIKNRKELEDLKTNQEALGTFLLLENGDALADNKAYIPRLKEEGFVIVGLTHMGKNRLADGNSVFHSEGISKDGKEVIHLLNENGIIIDVAHLHPKCFWQLLEMTDAVCVSSHTGVRDIHDIPRNIDLEQAKEIFDRGGVVGITFDPAMLSSDRKSNIELIFVHLDTLVQKFGPDIAGIGSDFGGFELITEGMEDIAGITALIDVMLAHGYFREDINKIMGLNWLRIYESLLP
jgi:membrane dipeptidase